MENKFSANEFTQFMDWLVDKGLMNKSTAVSRKLATLKILSALDEHELNDLRAIDREQAFKRFVNKFGREFKPGSLTAFKGRFNNAIDEFIRYVDNPSSFKVMPKRVSKTEAGDEQKKMKVKKNPVKPLQTVNPDISHVIKNATSVIFPIPIREGVVVQIHNVPTDLTESEAARIGAVIKALAVTIN